MYFNTSLTDPDYPSRDSLSRERWQRELVPLDTAIRAMVGPDELVIGDPTNFAIVDRSGLCPTFDQGWDLEF